MRKLHNNRGETLVEVLASILVASLSVALMFGCIIVSSNIDVRTKDVDESHYLGLTAADAKAMPSVDIESVTITRTDPSPSPGAGETSVPVAIYGGEGMYSYKATAAPVAGGSS